MGLGTLFAVTLLAGCRVGPKYVTPTAPTPPAFKEAAPDAFKNVPPGTWRPANPQDAVIKGKWWEIFNEPELNTLEEQLDINNQNIAIYFQNFMASRAIVGESRAQLFPTLTTAPQYQRTKTAGALRGFGTSTAGGGTTGTDSCFQAPAAQVFNMGGLGQPGFSRQII